ncbi:DUF1771-domain-containing protein [Lentinus tigrinus ALCF2SS1-6]|uniref:DUF1771-domain-containing protein n=1 Tax=Lentinus tigrinus ALCF2SS1-6 TaxID=1328759 RepID=A0A5C2SJP4_9APHY|nr:DUF1771-domain-containing protein [Lentinus tigrinus ALCF2SS1-6]
MGLLSDLIGGLFKCLCGGSEGESNAYPGGQQGRPPSRPTDVYVPPTVPHQPQVQQPAPIYPPSQPQRPQHAEKPHKPAHQPQEPHGPKKHRKHDNGNEVGAPYIVHTPGHVSPPSSPPSRPWSPGRPDPNQVNQHNEYYVGLRANANAAGDDMARNFDEAHKAYESGDGARAKELSNAGKAAQKEMERLNDEASAWIFRENNTDSKPGEVDLHGLYVKEAIRYADKSIGEARARGDSKIHFIVGKGLHSTNHVAKLKPAIEELIQKNGLVAEMDEQNAGVLIVNLDGRQTGRGPVLGPDELTRSLERKDECIIM